MPPTLAPSKEAQGARLIKSCSLLLPSCFADSTGRAGHTTSRVRAAGEAQAWVLGRLTYTLHGLRPNQVWTMQALLYGNNCQCCGPIDDSRERGRLLNLALAERWAKEAGRGEARALGCGDTSTCTCASACNCVRLL